MSLSGDSDAADVADIPVVCGPTGAGKSAIAMWIAEASPRGSTLIVSADSRQVYRGFDIGTAKPTLGDRTLVPHACIDVVDPAERYSAARWVADATAALTRARAEGTTAIVVGGTGLYLRALFNGLFEEPVLDTVRRQALASHLAALSIVELRRWVQSLDPARAHLGRTQLLRAIEIGVLTGVPISEWHRDAATRSPWRPRVLLVDPGDALATRNRERVDAMLAAGWAAEVRSLIDTVASEAPAWNAAGYRTMRRLVCGEIELPEARETVVIETRQYAKRQRTWFRHQLDPHATTRLDPTRGDWESTVDQWWRSTLAPSA
jgi:tRNA dimethylallyltransferase